jgi:hypothetical protein
VKRLFLALCLASIAACKKPEGHNAPAAAPAGQSAPAAAAWSDAKLKAYLVLQEGLLGVLAPVAGDGGRARIRSDEELAYEEGKLRRASGLTDAEVDTLNRLTAALVTRKVLQQAAEVGSMATELGRARAELPDGSVPEVDAALEVIAERKKREAAYLEERARFGDALVDVALPHEEALLRNWRRMMHLGQEVGEAREGEH